MDGTALGPQPDRNRSQPPDNHTGVLWPQSDRASRADQAKEMAMSRTIRVRNHPVVLIAAALLAAGSAAVVADGAFIHNPKTITDVPYTRQGSGPGLHNLTSVDRVAAQRLAELRAQRAENFGCIGMAYPARPC
jgi:hypothetical protein